MSPPVVQDYSTKRIIHEQNKKTKCMQMWEEISGRLEPYIGEGEGWNHTKEKKVIV
jgi:hypothetical protein